MRIIIFNVFVLFVQLHNRIRNLFDIHWTTNMSAALTTIINKKKVKNTINPWQCAKMCTDH